MARILKKPSESRGEGEVSKSADLTPPGRDGGEGLFESRRRMRSDVNTVVMAINNGFEISEDDYELVLKTARDLLRDENQRFRAAGAKLMLAADKANIEKAKLVISYNRAEIEKEQNEIQREQNEIQREGQNVNITIEHRRTELLAFIDRQLQLAGRTGQDIGTSNGHSHRVSGEQGEHSEES